MKKLFALSAAFIISACSSTSETQPNSNAIENVEPIKQTAWQFDCSDIEQLVIQYQGEKAWLFSPTGTVQLNQAISASGARYASGDNFFWEHQGEASAHVNGRDYKSCKLNRSESIWQDAKLRGVDYRAAGNEPSWHMEISHRDEQQLQLRLTRDYGENIKNYAIKNLGTNKVARQTRYTGEGVEVLIEGIECRDSMSGEVFKSKATLTVGDKIYRGCGRALH